MLITSMGCGGIANTPDASDGATDARDDAANDAGLVKPGDRCAVEGAKATGPGPWCWDTGGGRTTCTCRGGAWDCGKCPDCAIDLRNPPNCTICSLCNGGTATRCDGTTFVPKVCRCGCAMWNEWNCVDSANQTSTACPISDASTD